jgi:hypothetical protein
MAEQGTSTDPTKREFLKKATYVLPAVLTLAAAPSFASAGSSSGKGKKGKGRYKWSRKVKGYRKSKR